MVRAVKTSGELGDYVMEAGRRGRLYGYGVNDEKPIEGWKIREAMTKQSTPHK
jgi:hypothetical protein